MKNLLVTGGAGFIGSNYILTRLASADTTRIINLDALTYAGNIENLAAIDNDPRYVFVKGSIIDRPLVEKIFSEYAIDGVVHFAAESHVDRSITGPEIFITTNVLGTQILLDVAKKAWQGSFDGKRFVHVSTDEVYGSLGPTDFFRETTPLAPNSPYSSSKAGSDLIVRAYVHTFGFPAMITRCSNNYGPYQFPEKLIPVIIFNALSNKDLPLYGDGMYVRDWLYVTDHCNAIHTVLQKGTVGDVYNIGGNNEMPNITIVKKILSLLGKPESLINYVADRAGHDRRYAIDASKIKQDLGWEPAMTFEKGIASTVEWYCNNRAWWEKLLSKK